jgi:hypothetical protein
MRKSRVIGSLLGAIVLSLVSLGVVAGPAAAAVSCHKINAKGVGQDLGGGNTTANINGGGLLNGTTRGHFDVGGGTPPVLPISGTVEFTTNKATLTVGVNGSFNVASGDFDASGPVTASTGKLEGATGNLTLTGTEDLTTGRFNEKITGTICVDLAP